MKYKNIFVFLFTFSLMYIIYYSHLSDSIVGNQGMLSKIARDFTPQGWGFFTRNCKEYQFDYYRNGNLINIDIGNFSDLFGLKRISRFKARELMFLTSVDKHFLKWNENIDSCIKFIVKVPKYKLYSIDTGNYTIVRYKPIPWAWSGITNQNENPKKYLKVKLTYK